jgi:hypothetical protein
MGRGDTGTNPSRQRRFLSVPPTLLRWHVSVSPTLRSPYLTGQVRRKESYRCAVSRNERHCASAFLLSLPTMLRIYLRSGKLQGSTAAQSSEMQGKASPPCSTPLPPLHGEVHHIPVFCGTAVARNTCNHLSLMLDLSKNKYSCFKIRSW